jgi:hypothetical protein
MTGYGDEIGCTNFLHTLLFLTKQALLRTFYHKTAIGRNAATKETFSALNSTRRPGERFSLTISFTRRRLPEDTKWQQNVLLPFWYKELQAGKQDDCELE